MSVLTGGSQHASCSRVIGICRYLAQHKRGKSEVRAVLEAMMSPNSLRGLAANVSSRRDMIANTISECVKMRLLDEDAGSVAVRPYLLAQTKGTTEWLTRLPVVLADLFFAADNEENFNIARVIAWYLAQDPQRPPGTWQLMSRAIVDQEVSDLLGMNDARFSQFRDWICFLGFAWRCAKGATELIIPDPTEQIRLRLDELFADARNRSLPIGAAMERLAVLVPVLEGGRFRAEVEAHLPPRADRHLSRSTALAWLRLAEEGLIQLHEDADADMLVLPDGGAYRRFSRITYLPKEAGAAR